MCFSTTSYYTGCSHYGKPTIAEPCIRAIAANSKSGCWHVESLGVETVDGRCPRCIKDIPLLDPQNLGDMLSRISSASSFSSGSSTPTMNMLEGIKRSRSNMSLSSMASDNSNRSTDAREGQAHGLGYDLEREAFWLRDSAVEEVGKKGKVLEPENLHWRTFGGSAASVTFKRDLR